MSALGATRRAGDGGKKARFTGESTKETVKTIRAGNAGVFGSTCGYLLVCFFHTTRGRGWRLKHPAFPAPSSSLRVMAKAKLGQIVPRECRSVSSRLIGA
jgi:hypothetical protein